MTIPKLNTIDCVFEYKKRDEDINAIIHEDPGLQHMYYSLVALKDTWIFPWKRKVCINISQTFVPDGLIGIIYGNGRKYNVKTKIIISNIEYNMKVEINTKHILPMRIRKGDIAAYLSFVHTQECHLVEMEN